MVSSAAYAHTLLSDRASQISDRMTPSSDSREDWIVMLQGEYVPVNITHNGPEATIKIGEESHTLVTDWVPGKLLFEGVLDGNPFAIKIAPTLQGYYVRHRGVREEVLVLAPATADLHKRLPEKEKPDLSKLIISPMPGLVVSIDVELGQTVQEGEGVCIVEAMKMQNIIRAEAEGVVKAINVAAGDSVAADEIMIEFE